MKKLLNICGNVETRFRRGVRRHRLFDERGYRGGSYDWKSLVDWCFGSSKSLSKALVKLFLLVGMAFLLNPLIATAATSTTTALSSSLNPSTFGKSVTLTATVTGQAPTGTVTFKDGTLTLGTGSLAGTGNARTATYSISTLTVGSHSITAVYGGNSANLSSTASAVTEVVNKSTTTATLISSANPSTVKQTVTFSATVAGDAPGGTVTFKDGATTLGTATLSGTGNSKTATFASSTLSAASHSITAAYAGDANNAASTSAALVQAVSGGASSTILSATPNPATLGQSVTLTAYTNGYNPSGTVTFMDGTSTLGTGTLSGGAATLSINSLAAGSHSLSAVYSGDINNAGSTSAAVNQTIGTGAGMVWQYGYDAMGRMNSAVDPNGLASYTYYDSLGRAVQTQQPPNTGASTPTVTQLGYDLLDGLTQVADPRNLITSYSRNGLGQVSAQSSPDSGAAQYTYDANGNVLSSTDARGIKTQYTYDALNRVTSIAYPTGSATAFEYDGGASAPAQESGELTKVTDESGQSSYSHDALGRLISKTVVIGGKSFTVGYSWGDSGSALDKLTSITYPSGSRVNYGYDSFGSVSAISVNPVNPSGVGTSGTALPLLSALTYNADSNVTGWLWSDGKARSFSYDSFGMVSGYSLGDPLGSGASAGSLRSVNRDSAGRITGYSHTNNAAAQASLNQSFGYDNLNRLLSATQNATGTLYSYDANGNRTSKVIGGVTYPSTIEASSNRLVQTQDVGGLATVTYDAAGHVVSDGANTFAYSDRGRMKSVANAGGTVTYLYNGQNQRVAKSGPTALVPTGAAYYVYDEAGQLLGQYDASGKPVHESVYLGSMPVGVIKQSGAAATADIAVSVYNVSADHIDTPRVITRQADQAIVWRWDTAEAFGATAANQNPSGLGTFGFDQRFPGQVFDAETGLSQNWNREYNARQGRYIQSDPIGLQGGINTFGYVGGDPLSFVDLRGLQATGGSLSIQGGGGGGCDPEKCGKLRADIFRKFNLLLNELRKFDPVGDAKGGFNMPWGSGKTAPGGHAKEIQDLQRGLKNDIERYNRECKDRDDGGGGTFRAINRSIDEAANRPIPQAPGSTSFSWSPPSTFDPRTEQWVPGSGSNGALGGPPPWLRFMLP
jgi:RHS repeat-associated protein